MRWPGAMLKDWECWVVDGEGMMKCSTTGIYRVVSMLGYLL